MSSLLSFIVWNIRPEVFSFSPFPRWYGVMWGIGLMLSYEVMRSIYRQELKTDKEFSKLVVYIILGTVVGARLGHILFYDPIYYWQHPLEILPIKFDDNGLQFTGLSGLASHGGGMGILLAMFLYTRKYNIDYLWLADRLVIVAALSGVFIRLGNLFNSEVFGLPTTVPWAFVFESFDKQPRHPTQIYEALFCLILFVILFQWYKKKAFTYPSGVMLGLFLSVLFVFRFFIEFLKVDQENLDYGVSINAGQMLSIPFVFVGLFLIYFRLKKSKLQL